MTFSTAAQYLLLISPYSSCLRDLRVQFLELYTAFILSQQPFIFQENFTFSSEQSLTQSDSEKSTLIQFSVQRTRLCSVKFIYSLRSRMTSPRSTIYLKLILFQVFFNRSSIPDFRSPILDPSFPVNLEVLLMKIVLALIFCFDH